MQKIFGTLSKSQGNRQPTEEGLSSDDELTCSKQEQMLTKEVKVASQIKYVDAGEDEESSSYYDEEDNDCEQVSHA